MTRIGIIGAGGFVGSAFVRQAAAAEFEVVPITRENHEAHLGSAFDILVDAAGNSKKYLADEDPEEDFRRSVDHRLRTLLSFRADVHLHVSSVDVYEDLTSPATTREDRVIDGPRSSSRYGFHKLLAEDLVRHYAKEWLIVRLAGMVGPELRKNPVFDVLHDRPLRIHPDSRYQYMLTDDAARISLRLVSDGVRREAINVCGSGVISPKQIADLAGRTMDLRELPSTAVPRVVEASVEKLAGRGFSVDTTETIRSFVNAE